MGSYRELKVWQLAMELVVEVYRLTVSFPKHELYGLASQMQRAAVSLPSNIAEGQAREYAGEFHRFVLIALGSLAELETQILLALRLSYLSDQEASSLMQTAEEIGKMLRGLQKNLKSKLNH